LFVETNEHFNFACWWAIIEYYYIEDFACHFVTTLVLGLRPRQGVAKMRIKSEA
jgi:hypothetical protein